MDNVTNDEIEQCRRALKVVEDNIYMAQGSAAAELPTGLLMFIFQHAEEGIKARLAFETYKEEYGVTHYNINEALEKITDRFFEMGCIPEYRSPTTPQAE